MDLASYIQDTSLLLTICGALIIVYVLQILVTNLKLPAGPWGVPFLGYQPFLAADPLEDYNKLSKKYGEIFSFRLRSKINILLSSYEMTREVMVKNTDNFTGIVKEFSVLSYVLKGSIFQDEGESWKEQRKFFTACLREFGVGRLKTEKNIQNEAENVLHTLRDSETKPIDFVNSYLLRLMAFNVVSTVAFGKRFDYEDKELRNFLQKTDEFMTSFLMDAIYLERFPLLRFLPHSWTGLGRILKKNESVSRFLYDQIKEHEADFDANNIRDITDLYLKKHQELKAAGSDPEKTIFSKASILQNVAFLQMAGTEDTSVALSWYLKLAAKYPEEQKKMQTEMDQVVGRQRLPSWSDKSQLPYVEAFLYEAMRVASFVPLSMPHTNYKETTIKGHWFPKRTIVVSNYWHINHDPEVWGDPEEFRPDRFIGEDGKINKLKDQVLSFGSGARSCPGESVARMELFIFMTAIIQSFTLRPPPDEEFNFDCTPGSQRRLFTCSLCAYPRD